MIAGTMSGPFDVAAVVADARDGAIVHVHVRPRSSRRGVLGVRAGRLALGVGAAPEKGRATAEAVRELARVLGVGASRLTVAAGATSRSKRIAVAGMTAAEIRRRLAARLASDPS
jgi:uncharacterized protein